MLTQDEISKLAREYAEEQLESLKVYLGEQPEAMKVANNISSQTTASSYVNFLNWLFRTHCIVSKEKATELCRLTLEHGDSVDYGLIDGLTDIVCDIFGEQYHQVAEGLDNPEITKEVEL